MVSNLPVFNFAVRNQTSTTLEIAIDGAIVDASTEQMYREWFGDDTTTSFKSFRDKINNAVKSGVTTVNGTINSGGGYVAEAMAMHDFVQDLQARGIVVNFTGTGIVASAATYILMASKNSAMTKNSWFMLHDCSGVAYGSVSEVESQAAALRKFNDVVRDFYVEKTGLSTEAVAAMMQTETWLSAEEAQANGFIKDVNAEATFTNEISADKWRFKNTNVLQAYNSFTKSNPTNMDISKITAAIETGFQNMMEKLGIKNEGAAGPALSALSATIVEAITNSLPDAAATQAATDAAIATAITNGLASVNEAVTTQITNATKDTVSAETFNSLKAEFETVKEQIANRTAGKIENAAPAEKPSKFDHAGVSWGDSE